MSDGGGGLIVVVVKVVVLVVMSVVLVVKKNKNDLVEVSALSGDNVAFAKFLVKMENVECDVVVVSECFDVDV